jgi:hypothetical protein
MKTIGTRLCGALCLFFTLSAAHDLPPVANGWLLFSRVKYTQKLFKELDEYYLVPLLDTKIRQYENQKILLKGYYMPLNLEERNVIILSKFPYAACFFCGGAGPESVAEIHFKEKPPHFKTDQVVQVSGKLKLNDRDINHMNFILKDAQVIKP